MRAPRASPVRTGLGRAIAQDCAIQVLRFCLPRIVKEVLTRLNSCYNQEAITGAAGHGLLNKTFPFFLMTAGTEQGFRRSRRSRIGLFKQLQTPLSRVVPAQCRTRASSQKRFREMLSLVMSSPCKIFSPNIPAGIPPGSSPQHCSIWRGGADVHCCSESRTWGSPCCWICGCAAPAWGAGSTSLLVLEITNSS